MSLVLRYALAAIAAYLLGSLNFAIIISRLFYKRDIRTYGSGNAGSTNAYRMMGGASTAVVMLGDALKGVAAVLIAGYLLRDFGTAGTLGKLIASVLTVIGHSFPVYFGFKGGKGVLTSAAVLVMLDYRLFLIVFAVFIIVVLLFGYVSLASVCAALSLPVGVYALYGMDTVYLIFGVFISAAVVYLHRANIKRIFSGQERRFSFRKGKKE